jgi:branched-chain amino acid transport system ATP-binding protein
MTSSMAAPSVQISTLLSVRDLAIVFGKIVALGGVSFDVRAGEILGLIGPNGAGKTTLFNCLSRLYDATRGSVEMQGINILGMPPHAVCRLGMGRTFQNVALFPNLSVLDNVKVGAHAHVPGNMIGNSLSLPGSRRAEGRLTEQAQSLLDYFGLEPLAHIVVGSLPFGTQKRVELARALASHPKLLLLDEPAGGLNHTEVHELGQLIRHIRSDFAVTVMLVEHHMGLVMSTCDRIVALNFGLKLAEGAPHEIQSDPNVIRAYLGSKE